MKRRAAIEPTISHVKADHRMDRNYFKGRDGDRPPCRRRPQLPLSLEIAGSAFARLLPGGNQIAPKSPERLTYRLRRFFTDDY
jgi:hypothetical protein